MTVIVSPFIDQIGRAESYISLNEFKFSATAAAIDFTNLVANGAQAAQDRALSELIVRASAKIDAYCMGRLGTLNATSFTQNGRYRLDRSARFKIHPSYTPVIAVTSFMWGSNPGALSNLALTSANVYTEEEEIIILPWNSNGTTVQYTGTDAYSWLISDDNSSEYYTVFSYINGWPNSFTTTSTTAGASGVTLGDVTGIYPGTNITVWDGLNDEYCQVASNYVAGTSLVTFTNPLRFPHGIGVNVSAMHPSVKQACIHFTIAMVKARGQGGFIIDEQGATQAVTMKSEMSVEDEIAGYNLLDEFKMVSGRT